MLELFTCKFHFASPEFFSYLVLGVRETADEEYHKAIATNIVHELLYQRRVSQEAARKQSSKHRQGSPAMQRSTSPAKSLTQVNVGSIIGGDVVRSWLHSV